MKALNVITRDDHIRMNAAFLLTVEAITAADESVAILLPSIQPVEAL